MKADEAIEEIWSKFHVQDLGEITYNAIRKQAGGVPPPWEELPESVRAGWLTVGATVAAVALQRLCDVAKKIDQLSGGVNGQIQ